MPRVYGPFASFQGSILAREGGTFIAWQGATEFCGAISVLARKFRSEDQNKKVLQRDS